MVLIQKIDNLQIPPTGVDFLWFLQKSTLIGTFMKKRDFSIFFEFFKSQAMSKFTKQTILKSKFFDMSRESSHWQKLSAQENVLYRS